MTSLQYQLDLITVPLPKLEIIKFLIQHKYVDKLCRLCNKTWHTCHLHQVAYITRNFPSSNLKVCTPAMSGIEAVCSIYVVFSVALYAFYSKQKDKTFVVSSWVLLKWGGRVDWRVYACRKLQWKTQKWFFYLSLSCCVLQKSQGFT